MSEEKIQILPAKESEHDFRLVSHNILLQSLMGRRESKKMRRAVQMFDAFADMDADFFTLQEVDTLWYMDYKLQSLMKELGYADVPVMGKGQYAYLHSQDVRNPVFYKVDRFELLECGYDRYRATEFEAPEKGKAPEYPSSSYTWGVFEEIATGKKIAIFSTHLVARVNHEGATEEQKAKPVSQYHVESVEQLAAEMNRIAEKYNCGVVASGDYNHLASSPAYAYMKKYFDSARDECPEKYNLEYCTWTYFGKAPTVGNGAIDQCMYTRTGLKAKRFEQSVCERTWVYSDHIPIFFDFEI